MEWSRKEFKREAKKSIKRNYWFAVAVCFIVAFAGAETSSSTASIQQESYTEETPDNVVKQPDTFSNYDVVADVADKVGGKSGETTGETEKEDEKGSKSKTTYEDRLATTFDSLTDSNSFLFQIIKATQNFLLHHEILAGVVLLIAAVGGILFKVLVANGLIVGKRRFFLENRVEKVEHAKTSIAALGYIFKKGRFINPIWVMIIRGICLWLWWLTIIGGIIKTYEYRVIPYILAEAPNMPRKEVFRTAKKMTHGYKWKLFVFDFSFFWWKLLEAVTFGLAGVFWVSPYMAASRTEAYVALRNYFNEKEDVYDGSSNN